MKEYCIRDIQLAQLEMAKELKRVCEENSINYFMDSGTLLGAVRHNGFIPWDDDMDFGMLRNDYERFIRVAPQALSDDYFLQTIDNDQFYPYWFAKLRKRGTRYIETSLKYNRAHNELYIDIFPYDSYPSTKCEQKMQGIKLTLFRHAYMMKQNAKPWLNHTNQCVRAMVYIKYCFGRYYSFIHDKHFLRSQLRKEMIRYDDIETKEIYAQGSSSYGKWVINRKWVEETCDMGFEDTFFKAPKYYDEYLKRVYGDYMTLPPEKNRYNKHKIIEVEL